MAKPTRTERTALLLLALFLVLLLAGIAWRGSGRVERSAFVSGSDSIHSCGELPQPPSSLKSSSLNSPSSLKPAKKRAQKSARPKEPPRRHLDDTF